METIEFYDQYSSKKPNYEYWFGEAIQKPTPTWLHGVLQAILRELLRRAGYYAGTEIELRIDPDWQPVPDVIGVAHWIDQPYPQEPVDVVIEVLSPDDRMVYVLEKCKQYARIGTQSIFWIDPLSREGWQWDRKAEALQRVKAFELPNGNSISLDEVFAELDSEKQSRT